jgi:hypothetical protein
MEAQAAAQQLAQAAAQQAVLGCRSPVSVFKHNVLRWQMEAHDLAHRKPSFFVIMHASYLLHATYIQGCGH